LTISILIIPLYSQEKVNKINNKRTYYFGPTIGSATNTNNDESLYNAGISVRYVFYLNDG
jgi:hypothetical protein